MPASTRSGIAAVIATAMAMVVFPGTAQADETRDEQWALDELEIAKAHKETRGEGVTIGVVDSGIDANHPDLKDNVLPGMSAWDEGGDGLKDTLGHGTAMASDLVGHGHGDGRDAGVLGIAPEAKVLPVSVYPPEYKDDPNDSAINVEVQKGFEKGIRWLADQNVDVILVANAVGATDELEDAVSYAIEKKNIPLVAPAGNVELNSNGEPKSNRVIDAPAIFDNVFGVSGTTHGGEFWKGSVHDREVLLSAPADDIIAAKSGGGYEITSGTSHASAFTAGVVALMKAQWPDMAWDDIEWRITETATDLGKKGSDHKFGYGLINPIDALTAHVDPPDGIDDEQINPPVNPKASPKPDSESSTDNDKALTASTGFSTWIIITVVAVVLVLGVITTILLLRKRRKPAQLT